MRKSKVRIANNLSQ